MKLKKPKSSEVCPPGYHVVHGHSRTCESGTKTWVDTHIRRNRSKKIQMLLSENLLYLYWNSKKKYPRLGRVSDADEHPELDSAIQFWLEYWKNQGLKFPKIDPFLINTLIFVESSFNLKADPKVKESTAFGLMQLTNQTRRILEGIPDKNGYREMSSPFIRLSREETEDPVANIGAGIRWLQYKYKKIPTKAEKNTFNTIKNYHSWGKGGEEYAHKIMEIYKKSKKKLP